MGYILYTVWIWYVCQKILTLFFVGGYVRIFGYSKPVIGGIICFSSTCVQTTYRHNSSSLHIYLGFILNVHFEYIIYNISQFFSSNLTISLFLIIMISQMKNVHVFLWSAFVFYVYGFCVIFAFSDKNSCKKVSSGS